MAGWIKLHRKFLEHWLYTKEKRPFTFREAWLDLLLNVNYEEKKVNLGYEVFECKPGQSLLSMQSWAARWHWSSSKVRRFLSLLKKDEMVLLENVRKSTRITIINWESYQDERISSESQVNFDRKQLKKVKKVRTKNKEKDMFRTTEKNVVQEPLNGRLLSDFDWSKDVIEIVSKYTTLALVIEDTEKNAEFWDGHVDIMSNYFPTDSEMKRWFNQKMFEINNWQRDRPHQQSRTAKGLRQRISRWLGKEYQKVEVTKR